MEGQTGCRGPTATGERAGPEARMLLASSAWRHAVRAHRPSAHMSTQSPPALPVGCATRWLWPRLPWASGRPCYLFRYTLPRTARGDRARRACETSRRHARVTDSVNLGVWTREPRTREPLPARGAPGRGCTGLRPACVSPRGPGVSQWAEEPWEPSADVVLQMCPGMTPRGRSRWPSSELITLGLLPTS